MPGPLASTVEPIEPYVDKNALGDNVATDAISEKLAYTAPTDRTARVTHVSVFHNVGTTAVVELRLERGATIIVLRRSTAGENFLLSTGIILQATDKIALNVTTAGAAGNNADMCLGVLEQRRAP